MATKKVSAISEQINDQVENMAKTIPEAAEKDKLAKDTGEFCVYLGPSIRGVIQSGTIYDATKEETVSFLSSDVEKYPLIASLIVTNNTLAEDRIKVKTPGNLLYVNYKKLIAMITK